jgi:hypothetical protein
MDGRADAVSIPPAPPIENVEVKVWANPRSLEVTACSYLRSLLMGLTGFDGLRGRYGLSNIAIDEYQLPLAA